MRKTYPIVLIVAVLLSFGWMGAASAAHQDCCHPSAPKAGSSAALATTSARPMSSLNAEDVRKEFNASSQKVRVVATPLSHVSGLSVWTWGRRSGSQEIPGT
jgi:hypothetical protein